MRLRRGKVVAAGPERPGAIEVLVEVEGERSAALAYPDLVGPVHEGDVVLLNTTGLALRLGTGGFHLVVAVEGTQGTELGHQQGRVMKLRYTPLQVAVRSVEETHRDALEGAAGLDGMPVVAAPLHSMLGPISAGARLAGAQRVAYVMTDGAALPGSFSRLVPRLRAAELVDAFVTCGQAFGGELEAATLWTGLIASKEIAGADVAIVADGPGALGTGTRWGASALGSGLALNAVATLGGRAVAALRISAADPRERHRGLSHHSLTILSEICRAEANVAVPALDEPMRQTVWSALREARLEERHRLVEVIGQPALDRLAGSGVEIESMGRTPADDPPFFLAAGAAGILAGRMAAGGRAWRVRTDGAR